MVVIFHGCWKMRDFKAHFYDGLLMLGIFNVNTSSMLRIHSERGFLNRKVREK